jgi:hypothetical protein
LPEEGVIIFINKRSRTTYNVLGNLGLTAVLLRAITMAAVNLIHIHFSIVEDELVKYIGFTMILGAKPALISCCPLSRTNSAE